MNRDALIEQIVDAPEDHPLSLIEWIPVWERLPEDQFIKLVRVKGSGIGLGFFAIDKTWQHVFFGSLDSVTHWSKIPEVHDG